MSDIQTITVQAGGTVNIYFGCNFMGSGSPKRTRKGKATLSTDHEEDQVIEEGEGEQVYRREKPPEGLEKARTFIFACQDDLTVDVRTVLAHLTEEHVAEILAATSENLDEVLEGLFPDAV
jgi:hypothetical protein